jgi:hypothetical protein
MPLFTVRSNKNIYHVYSKGIGMIGPHFNSEAEANVICNWLNNSNLSINLYSFFSFDVSHTDENVYFILDRHNKVGKQVDSKKNAVAITAFCNSALNDLKEVLDTKSYAPITGDEPAEHEIKSYMASHNVGYYIALEELRKKKYKKI